MLFLKKKIGCKRKKIQGIKNGGMGGATLRPLHFHVLLYLFCFALNLHESRIDLFLPGK